MGNAQGGNDCQCCGCAICQSQLKSAAIPGFLSLQAGSWTPTTSGLVTHSTGAKLMLPNPTLPTHYEGVQFTVDVANAEAGDVAVVYFNSGWQGRWVCDDGSGTTGYVAVYNASGDLMAQIPDTHTGSNTLSLCLEKSITGAHYSGDMILFNGIGIDVTLSTLAVGFGTGAQNVGGLTFTNLEEDQANFDGDGPDPKSCPGCGDCTAVNTVGPSPVASLR